ncbi:MAG TPA: MATE family efflux transporter [Gemmatimonadaceae bacterium]|nr:MATE family efflux transporter [Gemmatimonadaceae bacterium]
MSEVSIAKPAPPQKFWSTVIDALRGGHHDYTQGSVARAIVLLAVPMVLEMALESVFAVVDAFWVGKLGPTALSTVGYTESMLSIMYAVDMGIGMGATALVARRIGEKDAEGAAASAGQAIVIATIASIVLGLVGGFGAPQLLALMGADQNVIAQGTAFTRVMLGGSGCILFLFLFNAIFRGAGDAAIAMRVLWFANIINLILDPCLIFGVGPFPHLGVTGAAVATTIGRTCGALFALSRLVRPGNRITLRWRHLRIIPGTMGRFFSVSWKAAVQGIIGSASYVGLVVIMSRFGTERLAGFVVSIRILIFALLPSWGLGNAAATMVGQALGAKEPDRAEKAVWLAAGYDCAVLSFVGLLFAVFAHPLINLFTTDPVSLEVGATSLRIMALGFPLYAYGMTVTQSFNGAGDTWTPTWINFGVLWVFEIPFAYFLAVPAKLGPTGVIISLTAAFSLLAVVSIILFRRGRWKAVAL